MMQLEGVDELLKTFKQFGPLVAKRAGVTGVRKAATYVRKNLKADAPKVSGTLRKSIGYKKLRQRGRNDSAVAYIVGLRKRYYYRTLEFGNKRVSFPTHPFAGRSFQRSSSTAVRIMIKGMKDAVYFEAGKSYRRSLQRR